MRLRARLLLCLLTALAFFAIVKVGLRAVLPPAPPAGLQAETPAHGPLTRHLAIVLLDGVRYDKAVDPAVMPHIARAMSERSSAEIWAPPVTMTTSAVLAMGTGQGGGLEQIIFNETARATPLDSWLGHAKGAGLRMAAVGDAAWFDMYPGSWSFEHRDPPGVSMEVDYNPEIFAAVYTALRAEPRPSVLVAHFVPTDHQAHVHGVFSEAYHQHLRGVDAEVDKLFAALGPEFTVFVLSDHGMTDLGKHGADSPVQRRAFVLAFGPGIREGIHPVERIEHIDLAATFAHLLGLPSPAQSYGHVVAEWLDLPDEARAAIACGELARLARYAELVLGPAPAVQQQAREACATGSPEQRIVASRRAARALAPRIQAADPFRPTGGWLIGGLTAAAFVLLGGLWSFQTVRAQPGRMLASLLAAAALVVLGVELTRYNENLPGAWPDRIRVALTVLANGAMLGALIGLRRFGRLLDRYSPLAATVAIGLLAATYTRYTQAEGYLLAAAASLALLVGPLRSWTGLAVRGLRPLASWRTLLALGLLAAAWPLGFADGYPLPEAFGRMPQLQRAVAVASILLLALDRRALRRRLGTTRGEWLALGGATTLAIAMLWLRSAAISALALPACLLLPAGAIALWRRGQRTAAELCALGSYVLVSRDDELPLLAGSIFVAQSLGTVIGSLLRTPPTPSARNGVAAGPTDGAPDDPAAAAPRPAAVAGIVALLFALCFLQRVGIQLGLDFTSFDWAAGTFGDGSVSMARIGVAIAAKHCLARAALYAVVIGGLPLAYRGAVLRGSLWVEIGRSVLLVTMLFECQRSFWTTYRVLGDLAHAFMAVAVLTLGCALWAGPALTRAATAARALPDRTPR